MTPLTYRTSCQESKGQPDKSQAKQKSKWIFYSSWNVIKIQRTTVQEFKLSKTVLNQIPKEGQAAQFKCSSTSFISCKCKNTKTEL